MLLAYLMIGGGLFWLGFNFSKLKGVRIKLPSIELNSIQNKKESTSPSSSNPMVLEEEGNSLLGASRTIGFKLKKGAPEIPKNQGVDAMEVPLFPEEGTHTFSLNPDLANDSEVIEANANEENPQPQNVHLNNDNTSSKVEGESNEIALTNEFDDDEIIPGDDDIDLSDGNLESSPFVPRSLSEQLAPTLPFAEGESTEEPLEGTIPLDLSDDAFESEDLDEVLGHQAEAVPLDDYLSRLSTVDYLLTDLVQTVQKRKKRQPVLEMMRQFSEVLEHYKLLNDSNINTMAAKALNVVKESPEKQDWVKYYYDTLRICQEGSSVVDELEGSQEENED